MNRKAVWGIISVVLAAITITMVAHMSKDFSFASMVDDFRNANVRWLLAAAACMFGFIWFEGAAIYVTGKALGYRRLQHHGTVYGAADVFFSAITPSASGGQPASAYFMIKDGMSIPAATTALLINLIMYTLALLTVGGVNLILRFELFMDLALGAKALICIGIFILILLCIGFYLALRKAMILERVCSALIHFLAKLHLMRHPEKYEEKLRRKMKEYQECSDIIAGHGKMLRQIYVLNLCQRLSQLGVTFMMFMALGKGLAVSYDSFAIQSFVAMGSNSIPIPGGMGGADYLMLKGFKLLVGTEAANMEMLCRGFTFYICVITSACIVLVGYFLRKMNRGLVK